MTPTVVGRYRALPQPTEAMSWAAKAAKASRCMTPARLYRVEGSRHFERGGSGKIVLSYNVRNRIDYWPLPSVSHRRGDNHDRSDSPGYKHLAGYLTW